MPRTAIDYSKCCIYKIEHLEDKNLVYVGHTTNWDNRKCEHKHRCNSETSAKHNLKLYQMIRDNGGWDNFRMIEVEKYPCLDRREADKRETEVMKELKSNMNTIKSFLSDEEKKDYKKKMDKEHYERYKTVILENQKTFRQNNKEVIQERKKRYYENNKEIIQERKKRYYENNKEKIQGKYSMKLKCDCGCEITRCHLKRHQQSIKHNDLMKALNLILK